MTPTLPTISAALRQAAALVERADRLLRPTRPQDVELRRASRELAERLARRSVDLDAALGELRADLAATAHGLPR
jgi:hypothetical protein